MGSIDSIKPLSPVLSSAVNKSKQHQEKKFLECRESNMGPLGAKQERDPFVLCDPPPLIRKVPFLSLAH